MHVWAPFLGLLASIVIGQINGARASTRRLGCEVFVLDQLPISGTEGEQLDLSDFKNTTVTQIVNNGFGNPLNKYPWSSVMTKNGELCIGTISNNRKVGRLTTLALQILMSPSVAEAWRDNSYRIVSGNPSAYSEGGEIWCTSLNNDMNEGMVGNKYHSFVRVFKATKDYVGFRKMIEYKGKIYAGAANGPDGPGLDKFINTGGLKFNVDDLAYSNFSANYAPNPKIKINPYYTTSIQQGIYGPEQIAHATQGAALFSGWPNGTGWSALVTDTLTTWDRSIRAMCISTFSNRLFVGTESLHTAWGGAGSKILTYDGNELKIVGRIPTAAAISTCIESEPGKMIFGLFSDSTTRLAVLDETNGDAITVVDNGKLAEFKGFGVMEIRLFKQHVYIGIQDNLGTMKLIRTNNTDDFNNAEWDVITDNGFATEQIEQVGRVVGNNIYPWSSAVVGDVFYLGTMVHNWSPIKDNRAQLWASRDGSTWTMLEGNGFGQPHANGFRTMQTDGTKLYVGLTSNLQKQVLSEKPYDKLNLIPRVNVPLLKPFMLVQ